MTSSTFSWVRCSEEGTVGRGTSVNKLGTVYTLGNLGRNGVKRGAALYKEVIEQFQSPETIRGFYGQFQEYS